MVWERGREKEERVRSEFKTQRKYTHQKSWLSTCFTYITTISSSKLFTNWGQTQDKIILTTCTPFKFVLNIGTDLKTNLISYHTSSSFLAFTFSAEPESSWWSDYAIASCMCVTHVHVYTYVQHTLR